LETHLPHILKINKSSLAPKPKKVGSYKYFVPVSISGVICKAMVDSGNLWKNVLSLDFLHQLGLIAMTFKKSLAYKRSAQQRVALD
jgi:hypothetical protein